MPIQRLRRIVDQHAASPVEGASYLAAFRQVTVGIIYRWDTEVLPRAAT